MFKEFKEFISRGNVMDLAVGVIIGAAFGKIVTSLVDDIIMPPIGWLIGGIDFKDLSLKLPVNPLNEGAEPVSINWGNFVQETLDFIIIAFCVFLLVKLINSFKKKEAPAPVVPAEPTPEEKLLTEIRDLLKDRK